MDEELILSEDGKAVVGETGRSLGHVTIPEGVTGIGENAFRNSLYLALIDIPDGVTSIGAGAFSNCKFLRSIVIPEGVTCIENFTFMDCESLQSVIIPNSVTAIGNQAFCGCVSLQRIDFPDSVTYIGDGALDGTVWYAEQPDGLIYANNVLYKQKGEPKDNSIAIREGTVSISPSALSDCTSLQSIIIPDSVKEIGVNAFYGCTSLRNIDIPKSVKRIEYGAFASCTSLQSIVLPEDVIIVSDAFEGCTSLQSIDFPVRVSGICAGAFEGTKWLDDQQDNLIYINNALYQQKEEFNDDVINVREGTFCISPYALSGCTSLQSIIIPDSVKEIGTGAFYYCTSLKEIHMRNRNPHEIEMKVYDPSIGEVVPTFEGLYDDSTLFVPPGTVDLYRKHPVFGKFEHIEEDNR